MQARLDEARALNDAHNNSNAADTDASEGADMGLLDRSSAEPLFLFHVPADVSTTPPHPIPRPPGGRFDWRSVIEALGLNPKDDAHKAFYNELRVREVLLTQVVLGLPY